MAKKFVDHVNFFLNFGKTTGIMIEKKYHRMAQGFFGFLGFYGINAFKDGGTWLDAMWFLWFVWFVYFIPKKNKEK